MSTPAPNTCVFCGQPIGPDEPIAGRPPIAGHVACADAALADDRHWDAIAEAGGPGGAQLGSAANEEPDAGDGRDARDGRDALGGREASDGRAGCLGVLVVIAVAVLRRR